MKRNILIPKILVIFITAVLLVAGCVPKVGSHTLKIDSDPGKIKLIVADTPEEVNSLSNDEELITTPFSQSFPFGKEVVVKIVDAEPGETDEELYIFDHWSDGSYKNPRTINITTDIELTAKNKKMVKIKVSSNLPSLVKFEESGWYESGEELSLTAPEVDGYKFAHWKINDETRTANPLDITIENPAKIEAVYSEIKDYSITINTSPVGLNISLDNSIKVSPVTFSVEENTEHTIEMITPQDKNESDYIDGNDTRYSFDSWNDGSTNNPKTIIVNENTEITAQTNKEYKVEITTIPEDIANIEGSGWYEENATLSLTHADIEGYEFSHWQVNGEIINKSALDISINEPKMVVAVYNFKEYTLTFKTEPSGLDISINEHPFTTPKSLETKHGDTVHFSAIEIQKKDISNYIDGEDSRYTFIKWNDGNSSPSREFIVNNDESFTAIMKTDYYVKVSSEITEINGSGWYESGEELSLTAPEVDGYKFAHWKINDEIKTVNPLVLTIENPAKIEAVYSEIKDYSITINTSPVGLNISLDNSIKVSPVTFSVEENTEHTIEMITPQDKNESDYIDGNDTRYSFDSWNDGSTKNPRTITVDDDTEITAKTNKEYKVEITTTPEDITNIEGSGWYEEGYSLSLTPKNIGGYDFSHWKVNGEIINENTLDLSVDEPKKVVAVYETEKFSITFKTIPSGLNMKVNEQDIVTPHSINAESGKLINFAVPELQEKNENKYIDGNDTKYTFIKWNDESTSPSREFTVTNDESFTAIMKTNYYVKVSSEITEINGSDWYESGEKLSLSAPEVDGYVFSHWKINDETRTANPLDITIENPAKIEAVYSEIKDYTLTITTSPVGLNISLDNSIKVSPVTFSVEENSEHTIEMITPQDKNESDYIDGNDTRYSFDSWNDGSTNNPKTIIVNENTEITAQTNKEYKVEITTTPEDIANIEGSGWYEEGSVLSLSPVDTEGYAFSYWKVNGETINENTLDLSINEPKMIIAIYNEKEVIKDFVLKINTIPENLLVKIDGVTTHSPSEITSKEGTTHTFSFISDQEKDESNHVSGADTKYIFDEWDDGNTEISRTIKLNSDKTFTANTTKNYKVEISTEPSGIVEINGEGWYKNGEDISVNAPNIDNHNFLYWKVNESNLGEEISKTLEVIEPLNIKAVYNTHPSVEIENITVEKGKEVQVNLLEYSSDPDNDSLTYHLVSGPGNINLNTYLLDTSSMDVGEYEVELRVEDGMGGSANDTFAIDITESNNPPNTPSSPVPEDNSSDQETSLTLSWNCSDPDNDSLTYNLYFGTDENPELLKQELSEKAYSVNSLKESTTYYWKVVAEDSKGATAESPVWSFSTKQAPPEDGVDLKGPVYSGNILLVNNESESTNKEYTGTLSEGNYLPEGESLPENLEIEAYMVDPELPLPDNANPDNLAKPKDFTITSLGDTKIFWVRDFSTNEDYQITATLQYSGNHCEVWAENPEEITSGKAAELGNEFDNSINPLITEYFYTPSDVNNDGKVAILALDIRDNFDTTGAYIGGYFYSMDLFNVSGSNKMEIFYIDTYPTMHYPKTNEINVSRAYSTLAHEFQHMVNFNRNYLVEYGDTMPTWLNEGLSLAAEHLYRGVLSSRISYYNKSSNIKNGHSLLYWGDNNDTLSNYSLSYLFLQYIRTQAGSNNVFKDILLDNKNDSRAVINALSKYGVSKSFGDLMTDFRLALLMKESSGPYGFNGDGSFSNIDTQLYTGSAKDIRGGTAFFKAINGSYEDPGNGGSSIQYAGIFN